MVDTERNRRWTRRGRCVAAATVLGALGVVAGTAPRASAQVGGPSQGCNTFNDPTWEDFLGQSGSLGAPMAFHAGETITVRAGEPTADATPTATELYFDIGPAGSNKVVDSGAFPATLTYTMPADGTHNGGFRVDAGQATWHLSCTAPLGGGEDDGLADTGSASGVLVVVAGLAVAGGAMTCYAARRKVT